MTNEQIKNLLEECCGLYSSHRGMYQDPQIAKEWFTTLKKYDKRDIYSALERHKEGAYSHTPIVLNDLIRNLRTIKEKEQNNYENFNIYCKNCGKIISYVESNKHEEKCRSIEYIVSQYKKWFCKDIPTEYLWSLTDDDFEEKYTQLLKYIYNNTKNENEKKYIGNFLLGGNNE